MNEKLYRGKVYLKNIGHPIVVETFALNPSAAKNIIEAMYDGQIKQFAKQMSEVR